MDGWAVAGSQPWQLVDAAILAPGEATPIVTGGLIPDGTFGVLRSEHGQVGQRDGRRVLVTIGDGTTDGPRAGQHIRSAGEEARVSDVVIMAGTSLSPAQIAVAAACGHDFVLVARRPRVGLVFTGDEVVETGIPAPGYVRDSFGPQLPAFIGMLGGVVTGRQRLADDLGSLISAIAPDAADSAGLAETDVIITTGGTGYSTADHLRAALEKANASLIIDSVAMRPGGPNLLARLADGRLLVGLPGNPLAAMMGILTLVQPLLAALQGSAVPPLGSVVVAETLSGGRGHSRLIPYRIVDGLAVPTLRNGSGMMRGLAEASGIIVCPAQGANGGDSVETLALPWIRH